MGWIEMARVSLSFFHNPVVSGGDCLIGALVFDPFGLSVESVSNLYINGEEIPPTEYTVYLGDQVSADPALLSVIPNWTPKHIFRGKPYIALRAKFSDRYVTGDSRLIFTAEVATPTDTGGSRERSIFAVFAVWEYEGSRVVKVFEDRLDAEEFCDECIRYAETKEPPFGEILNTPENDAEFDAWWERDSAWIVQHPAKDYYSADSYTVGDLTLVMAKAADAAFAHQCLTGLAVLVETGDGNGTD